MKLTTVVFAALVLAASVATAIWIWRLTDENATLRQQLTQHTTQVDIENTALNHRLAELERYAHERGVDLSAYAGAAAGGGGAPAGEPGLPQ